MEPVYYSDTEFEHLLQQLEAAVQQAENAPFLQTRELLTTVLQLFDLMHREPLARLMKLIACSYPDLKDSMQTDHTIKTLFSLYDLLEGEIERISLQAPQIHSFVPLEQVGILTPVSDADKIEQNPLHPK